MKLIKYSLRAIIVLFCASTATYFIICANKDFEPNGGYFILYLIGMTVTLSIISIPPMLSLFYLGAKALDCIEWIFKN